MAGIRVLSIALSALLIVTTGILAAMLTIVTYQQVVSDTEESLNRGINDVSNAGEQNVKVMLEGVLRATESVISTRVAGLFEPPQNMLRNMLVVIRLFDEEDTQTWQFMSNVALPALYAHFRSLTRPEPSAPWRKRVSSVRMLSLAGDPKGGAEGYLAGLRDAGPHYISISELDGTKMNPPEGYHSTMLMENDGSHPDWFFDGRWKRRGENGTQKCVDSLRDSPGCILAQLCECADLTAMFPCGTEYTFGPASGQVNDLCNRYCGGCIGADTPAPPPAECADKLSSSPACTFGRMCDCGETVKQFPCGTAPTVGGFPVDISSLCQKTCGACPAPESTFRWGCLPMWLLDSRGRRLKPTNESERVCNIQRSAEVGRDITLGDCCLSLSTLGFSTWRDIEQRALKLPANRPYWGGVAGLGGVAIPGQAFTLTWDTNQYNDPVFGATAGVVTVQVSLKTISDFLNNIEGLPREYRIYIVSREAVVPILGDPPRPVSTDMLVAVSRGNAFQSVADTFGLPIWDVRHCTNATDPIIRQHALYVLSRRNGTHEGFDFGPFETTTVWNYTNSSTNIGRQYFSRIHKMQNDYGQDWRLVMLLPFDEVLGDVLAAWDDTYQRARQDKADLDDQTEQGVNTMIITVVCSGVVLLCLAVVSTVAVTRPIVVLQRSMERVENMQLEGADTGPQSVVSEVAAMQRAFQAMLHKLMEYRSYLPPAVLQSVDQGEADESVPPPPSGEATIVFTDIVGSSRMWEASPCGMNDALELHNEVIRAALRAAGGYEVKTIGDSFMAAFLCPAEGMRFAQAVHLNLVKAQWPADPMLAAASVYYKRRDYGAVTLWNGITVRIGMHCGEVLAEQNSLTGRTDYRGGAVNLAARLESTAKHGTTCVSQEVYKAVQKSDVEGIAWQDHGRREMRGIGNLPCWLAVPASLKERYDGPPQGPMVSSTGRPPAAQGNFLTSPLTRPSMAPSAVETKGGRSASLASESSERGGGGGGLGPQVELRRGRDFLLGRGGVMVVPFGLEEHSARGELAIQSDLICSRTEHCMACVQRTSGVVNTVTGTGAFATWNITTRCGTWRVQPLTCAALLCTYSDTTGIGFAVGPVLHGSVGAKKQRMMVMVGFTVFCAEAISKAAIAMGARCLACFTPQAVPALEANVLRPVDVWGIPSHLRSMRKSIVTNKSSDAAADSCSDQSRTDSASSTDMSRGTELRAPLQINNIKGAPDQAAGPVIIVEEPDVKAAMHVQSVGHSSDDAWAETHSRPGFGPRYRQEFYNVVTRGDQSALASIADASRQAPADSVLAQVVQSLTKHVERHPDGANCLRVVPFLVRPTEATVDVEPTRSQSEDTGSPALPEDDLISSNTLPLLPPQQ
eukprot:TRINITY_DN18093_c0_g1_i2.p1 TRINITY_DN18093_c0_g1~~TRINITY_DN18093_c0_g1_i2.p1  ORF type:complete len:1397 (+),score=184.81 TRINITY_DN18093_c0_g1_i2:100-4191(+)